MLFCICIILYIIFVYYISYIDWYIVSLLLWQYFEIFMYKLYNFVYYFCILYFIYRLIYFFIAFMAVFWDIYHEILRTAFLPKTANDCSDMLENWFRICSKITIHSLQQSFFRFGNKIEQSVLTEFRNLLLENK